MIRGVWLLRILSVVGALPFAMTAAADTAQDVSSDGPLVVVRASGTEACPAARELRQEIDQRLGRDPWDHGAPAITVTTIPTPMGVSATIARAGDAGQAVAIRRIDARGGCEGLRAPLFLVLSIALDGEGRQVIAAKVIESPSSPAVLDGPMLTWWGGGGALFVVNGGPEPLLGGNLFAEARWPSLVLDLEARVAASGLASTPELGGSFRLLEIESAFALCYRRAIFLGCALIEGGAVVVSGYGYLGANRGVDPTLSVGLRFGGEIPFSENLAARLSLDLTLLVDQPIVQLRDGTTLWQQPLIGAALSLSLLGHR